MSYKFIDVAKVRKTRRDSDGFYYKSFGPTPASEQIVSYSPSTIASTCSPRRNPARRRAAILNFVSGDTRNVTFSRGVFVGRRPEPSRRPPLLDVLIIVEMLNGRINPGEVVEAFCEASEVNGNPPEFVVFGGVLLGDIMFRDILATGTYLVDGP